MTPPLDDPELDFHVEMLTRRFIEDGLDPASARQKALARMGDLRASTLARNTHQQQTRPSIGRWGMWVHDIRHAWRVLLRAPGFVAIAVVMLGLGTGVSTAVFSVVDAVIFRSPFHNAGSVAMLTVRRANDTLGGISVDHYRAMERALPAPLKAIGLHDIADPVATRVDAPKRTQTVCLSAGMPTVIGTQPLYGRWFTEEETRHGVPTVALVSHTFWKATLAGDPAAVGRVIALNDQPVTIIGIMPPGFDGPYPRLHREIWVPYAPTSGRLPFGCRAPRDGTIPLIRLREGYSLASAAVALTGTVGPDPVSLRSYADVASGDGGTMVVALAGAVLSVLLIAFVNVTNLGLERLAGRQREIAVQLALGATRARIVRQTIAEHLLVAGAGAAAGICIASVGFDAMVALLPASLPNLDAINLNARVLLATVGFSVVGGIGAGSLAAWHSARAVTASNLIAGDRGHTSGRSLTRKMLVTAEIALGVLLLVGALLMVRTFLTLRPGDTGFDAKGKHIALIRMPPGTTVQQRITLVEGMQQQLLLQPGVTAVAATTSVPWRRSVSILSALVGESKANIHVGVVTPNYFDVMGIPILRGRGITAGDNAAAQGVAVVNETLARRWFPNAEPLGQVITITEGTPVQRRVVGIIADTRSFGRDTRVQPYVYTPLAQGTGNSNPFLMLDVDERAAADLPSTVRAALSVVQPGLLVDEVERLLDEMNAEVAYPRLGAWLFGSFAGLAVLLAAIGLGATLAWTVVQRRREIGIRVALGANRAQVRHLILGQTAIMSLCGIALGLLGAAWATQLLADWLYGVSPLDAVTYAACGLLMLAVSLIAAWVPASRAGRVDPAITLRGES